MQYLHFNNRGNFFLSIGASDVSGDDGVCDSRLCIGFETNLKLIELGVGWEFGFLLNPFATATDTES